MKNSEKGIMNKQEMKKFKTIFDYSNSMYDTGGTN